MNDSMLQAVDLMEILIHGMSVGHCDLNTGMIK